MSSPIVSFFNNDLLLHKYPFKLILFQKIQEMVNKVLLVQYILGPKIDVNKRC